MEKKRKKRKGEEVVFISIFFSSILRGHVKRKGWWKGGKGEGFSQFYLLLKEKKMASRGGKGKKEREGKGVRATTNQCERTEFFRPGWKKK